MNSSLSFEQGDKEHSHFLGFTLLTLKKALYLSVNVFSMKVLIGDTIFFMSPTGDRTAILRGHPSQAKVYSFAGQREYLHFSVVVKFQK